MKSVFYFGKYPLRTSNYLRILSMHQNTHVKTPITNNQ